MSSTTHNTLGSVVSLWRYPVKSMMGEELNASDITDRGLLGDRAYAIIDSSDGKVASAKNPRKWGNLFSFRAAFVQPPRKGQKLPHVRITFPDGSMISSEEKELNEWLSNAVGRKVSFEMREHGQEETVETTYPNPWMKAPSLEEYWPDMEGLSHRDAVTDEKMPEGTFFDCAVIHLLTTATLDQLRELYPQGRFEVRRFRPNIVVQTPSTEKGFVENNWIGQTLSIGDNVRIRMDGPCPRCVMTTLEQSDLPKDPGILRTAAQHNQTHVGLYGTVLQGGTIRRGDHISM
ncbi:MAG TPA: MOSC domain-containing protein [Flavisolibacter sp.]|nr:MOSC domain-containing protein [Flavisolibacter sp.]